MSELDYRVPATAEDLRPPKPSSLKVEAENFLRAHWDEVKGDYQATSGEIPSPNGSIRLDEASFVFKVRQVAKDNGFPLLGNVLPEKLRLVLRRAFKSSTGIAVRQLEKQRKRIEHHG